MSAPRGKAAYKKKEGIITIADDQKSVTWTPLPGTGPPVVALAIANITNLQQTPDTAPKVMLKIFEKLPSAEAEPTTYLFHFNSPTDARTEANSVKDVLSRLIADARGTDPSVPKPAGRPVPAANGSSGSAAMSFASTVNAKPPAVRWYDDGQLKLDIPLQQSLMKKNRHLHQIYMDARATKPETISDGVFNSQFWSTRIHLLRSYAIEMNQKRGGHNVLSAVKSTNIDGVLKLNMTADQAQLILQQHPLVRKLYNEHVPKVPEEEFWSRFFGSRLCRQLKGERVTDAEYSDPIFDRGHNDSENSDFGSRILAQQVPHIIDLEGNEENQGGFKGGNRKDVEMRPRKDVPVVRALNSLSERIMLNVAPTDHDPAADDALDDDTFTGLALRDLQGDAEANRIRLNVKAQGEFFANQTADESEDAQIYEKQVPSDVLFSVEADVETLEDDGSGGLDLHKSIGVDDDSDSDEETQKTPHVGSRASMKEAQEQILAGMKKKRAQTYGHEDDETSPMGIPPDLTQKCILTNATTTEFLKQFWNAFLSGDPDRAQELSYHVESLKRSLDRIRALADEAETVREQIIEAKKQEIREYYQRTRKKTKWKPDLIRGGRQAVMDLLESTVQSLVHAQDLYQKALLAEGLRASTEG